MNYDIKEIFANVFELPYSSYDKYYNHLNLLYGESFNMLEFIDEVNEFTNKYLFTTDEFLNHMLTFVTYDDYQSSLVLTKYSGYYIDLEKKH